MGDAVAWWGDRHPSTVAENRGSLGRFCPGHVTVGLKQKQPEWSWSHVCPAAQVSHWNQTLAQWNGSSLPNGLHISPNGAILWSWCKTQDWRLSWNISACFQILKRKDVDHILFIMLINWGKGKKNRLDPFSNLIGHLFKIFGLLLRRAACCVSTRHLLSSWF